MADVGTLLMSVASQLRLGIRPPISKLKLSMQYRSLMSLALIYCQ